MTFKEYQMIVETARAAAPVFERMGWEYESGEERYIPDAVDLAFTIMRLWESCEDGHMCSSGRWHVTSEEDEDTPGTFRKVLVLEFGADDD